MYGSWTEIAIEKCYRIYLRPFRRLYPFKVISRPTQLWKQDKNILKSLPVKIWDKSVPRVPEFLSDIRTNGDYYLIFKVTFKIENVGKTRRREVNRGKFVNSEKSKKDLLLKHNGSFVMVNYL